MILYRAILNRLFYFYWDNYKQFIYKDINYLKIAKELKYIRRFNSYEKYDGVKFALAFIKQQISKLPDGLDKKQCELYLKLNERFHPKTITSDEIKTKIKYLIKDKELTHIFGIDIYNTDIINLTKLIDLNKELFEIS